jgi:hypothetical protein
VEFISEAHSNAVPFECRQLFDPAIVEFFRPLALQKFDYLVPSLQEFGAISPARVGGVGKSDLPRSREFQAPSIKRTF